MPKTYTLILLAFVVGAIGFVVYTNFKSGPTNLGPFVSCLKDKGVVFYGAFWCPHCQSQKAMIGSAAPQLPYVECSTPDGFGENQTCKDKGIKGYPTWKFPDGSESVGETSLAKLSEKSGCALPPPQ